MTSTAAPPAHVVDLASHRLTGRLHASRNDYLLALLPAAMAVGMLVGGRPALSEVISLALVPVAVILIGQRDRYPGPVALALTLLSAASPASLGLWVWAVISLATRRRAAWLLLVGVGVLASAVTAGVVFGLPQGFSVATPQGKIIPGGWLAGAVQGGTAAICYVLLVIGGCYLGARAELVVALRERAEAAERNQALQVAAAAAAERARLAREMHDVLAHRISLVSMHAQILTYRDDLPPEQVRKLVGLIGTNANESLVELRAVLGMLRDEQGAAKPQPTLADLAELVRTTRADGASVELIDELEQPERLPVNSGRHAYRIVQESLTNARKHAAGEPVRLRLAGRPGEGLDIEVRNRLSTGADVPKSGLGLIGLRERAQLVGGRFRAGVEQGEFVVQAWLPWP